MVQPISPAELHQRLQRGDDLQLVDVRQPWEHELVNLPGSDLLPMPEIPVRVDELDRSRPVVAYCHHGIRSEQVGAFLVHCGFREVYSLEGGIDAYAQEVDPELARY